MSYAAAWVKTDARRFPRTVTRPAGSLSDKTNDLLSVFSDNTALADARAFATLMAHLKAIDGSVGQGTVFMAQVKNEAGVLGDTRDRNNNASEAFEEVPADFFDVFEKEKGTLNKHIVGSFPMLAHIAAKLVNGQSWEDTFGKSINTNKLFMAYYYYARFLGEVAKVAYDLPMYTNAALQSTPQANIDTTGGGSKPVYIPAGVL